jgi:16S rRNA (adenine1518-N6/adenine1519-N6)-dimethyltransferase
MTMDLSVTKALLRKHHFRPNKLRGQHFLVNPTAAHRIVAAAELKPQEMVLEVGPGLGALTEGLLVQAGGVIAVEVDGRLCAILREELGDRADLQIIHGDFLNLDLPTLAREAGANGLKIVGNLPYQITGQAIRKILDHLHLLRSAVITVQREVADRIMAQPGGKTFGVLSVASQYLSQPELVLRLRKEAFYPRPQIASTVLRLASRSEPPVEVDNEALFFITVRALFGHRRKTARNALRTHPSLRLTDGDAEALSRWTGLDLGRRGETMSLEELGQLSNALGKLRHVQS